MSLKSFLLLEMAQCLCTRRAFFGNEVFTPGKVFYICGEGRGALERRLKALKIIKGGFNENLMILDTPINIDSSIDMGRLKNMIAEHIPRLVIFDTFASLNNGTNENDPSEVARTLRLIKETCRNGETSSLFIHHLGKDESRGGRGASNFKTDVDFLFEMKRLPDSMMASLSCIKMKDGDNFSDIYMTANIVELGLTRQDGNETTSLILQPSDYVPTEKNNSKPLGVVSKNILTVLHQALEKNGVEPPQEIKNKFPDSPKNCPVKVVHLDDFRPFAYPYLNVAKDSKRMSLKRCIENLEENGKVMFFNDYLWPCA
jgi:putative DNA primase/helicase